MHTPVPCLEELLFIYVTSYHCFNKCFVIEFGLTFSNFNSVSFVDIDQVYISIDCEVK